MWPLIFFWFLITLPSISLNLLWGNPTANGYFSPDTTDQCSPIQHIRTIHLRPQSGLITTTTTMTSTNSVLPRPLLQGAAPCPLFVTPCPFEKAEMTPCPFIFFFFFFFLSISHTWLLALFCPFCCPHTAWIVLCIFYWAIQGHF